MAQEMPPNHDERPAVEAFGEIPKVDPSEMIADAETRLAKLDASAKAAERSNWQFGLGQLLVLLTVVAVYLGVTRTFEGLYRYVPAWLELSSGAVMLIWMMVVAFRTASRYGSWSEGRHRDAARREALEQLMRGKRSLMKQQDDAPQEADPSEPRDRPAR